jgi:Arc/MetJ family transcription regulator
MNRHRKTVIDLDLDALDEAMRVLGLPTTKATINTALREIVRQAAAKDFLTLAHSGELGLPGTDS